MLVSLKRTSTEKGPRSAGRLGQLAPFAGMWNFSESRGEAVQAFHLEFTGHWLMSCSFNTNTTSSEFTRYYRHAKSRRKVTGSCKLALLMRHHMASPLAELGRSQHTRILRPP